MHELCVRQKTPLKIIALCFIVRGILEQDRRTQNLRSETIAKVFAIATCI